MIGGKKLILEYKIHTTLCEYYILKRSTSWILVKTIEPCGLTSLPMKQNNFPESNKTFNVKL